MRWLRAVRHWFAHVWTVWTEPQTETVVYTFFNPKQRPSRRQFQTRRCEVCGQVEEREL